MKKRIPTGKTYTFSTVGEMVEQLSADQLDDFLIDFGSWLRFVKTGKSGNPEFDKVAKDMADTVRTLAELLGEDPDKAMSLQTQKFGWIDDGAHNKKLRVGTPDDNGDWKDGVVLTVPDNNA